MDYRQVEEIDAYGFPNDLIEHPLLAWMGNDYVGYVAIELLKRFQEQSPGTKMLAIKCEEPPRLLTTIDEGTGAVGGVEIYFNLQLLLRISTGQCWRVRGDARFAITNSAQSATISPNIAFDIRTNEEVT